MLMTAKHVSLLEQISLHIFNTLTTLFVIKIIFLNQNLNRIYDEMHVLRQSSFDHLTKSNNHTGYINSNNIHQSDGTIHSATYPGPGIAAQVEHDEVGVAVVGVLEAGDHVAVVLRDGQVADGIGEPDS